MNSFNIIETRLIKNLLRFETCYFQKDLITYKRNKNYFLGFKKGLVIVDLEKSVLVYFKALQAIRKIKKSNLGVLFVGGPQNLEKKLAFHIKKPHTFVPSKKWCFGDLSNNPLLQKKIYLAVVFNQNLFFDFKELYKKNIPAIGFVDNRVDNTCIDFPIFLNLDSKSSVGLFFYLINQSM